MRDSQEGDQLYPVHSPRHGVLADEPVVTTGDRKGDGHKGSWPRSGDKLNG